MSDGLKRRDFLKVMGAGSAVATAGCSTGEVEALIPYVVPDENIVPGVPTWYASTCTDCSAGCGIHVETHSGRVTKLEGNPVHPISRGNLCARGQAAVQGLYNPDRFRGPISREGGGQNLNLTWGTAERLLVERIREAQQQGGAGSVVLLTRRYNSSLDALVDEWVAGIGARRVIYDPWAAQPRALDFSTANVLVSFGADFLETWGSPLDYQWQFAQMRAYRNGSRAKFVWVGPHRPLTGLNADQWIAPRPGSEIVLARALAGQVDAATASSQTDVPAETIQQLITEFRAGNGVALGPGAAISGANAAALGDVINGINAGRAGTAAAAAPAADVLQLIQQMQQGQIRVLLVDAPDPAYTLPGGVGFAEAFAQVPTRVSFSSFPDDTAQLASLILPDHHFLEAWGDTFPRPGVSSLVQPAMRPVFNTKQVGDVLISTGMQLGMTGIAGGAATYYDYLRTRWNGIAGGGEGWRDALRRGGVFPEFDAAAVGTLQSSAAAAPATAATPAGGTASAAQTGAAGAAVAATAPVIQPAAPTAQAVAAGQQGPANLEPIAFEGDAEANFHLVVYPSSRFYDGRDANKPWLLELPDPVTKVPWGSWVEIHPTAAEELGVEQGDVIEIASPYGSLETYAYVFPGVRPDTVAIQTGLGHRAYSRYSEDIGVNPNILLGPSVDTRTGNFAAYGQRVRVSRSGGAPRNGVNIPGPGLFEQGQRIQHDREIARAVSVAELATLESAGHAIIPGEETEITTLRGYGGFAPVPNTTEPSEYPPPETHYGEYTAGNPRWAMVVDLNRCTGCAACVIACYAENNIPVVGPEEVKRGRDLTWLRIERYWGVTQEKDEVLGEHGTDDTRFLPMLCQHCGNAPCEPVCPVYAAYHTPDGLNGQVYNRCVGTRYCANNCPYKVRVFNWFTYKFDEPLQMQLNPDVAVREKGVMEKCTFCVQRIREKERGAALENRPVADGEVVPACVQTCPSEVFVFGDITNPDSAVARAARSVRGYRVLDEINVQSSIVYLSRVTLETPARGGHHAAAGAEAGAAAH